MFKKEFNDEIRIDETFKKTFTKYSKIFSLISFLLLIGVFFLSDLLVPLLFGEKWTDAVPIIKVLAFMVSSRYIAAGLSAVLLIGHLPKYDIFFQLSYFIVSLISIYWSKQVFNTYNSVINSYTISSIILYVFYFILMKYFSNKKITSK